jgi:exosome complex component RRP42
MSTIASIGLSLAEQTFIRDGVAQDLRNDGRQAHEYRAVSIESGVLANCHGSARVIIAGTDVCVGVKLVVSQHSAFEANVELAPGAAATTTTTTMTSGADDEAVATRLTRSVQALCGEGRVVPRLDIAADRLAWTVHADALVTSVGGANLLDAVLLALRVALRGTRVPEVHAVAADGVDTLELDVVPSDDCALPLDVSRLPLGVTLTRIGDAFVVDASPAEQCCASGTIVVAVNHQGIYLFYM